MSTKNIEGVEKFSYWIDIFTSQNHGPQYRPISFFGFFYMYSKFIGTDVVPLHLLGVFLLFLSSFYLFKILSKINTSRLINFLLVGIFIFHPLNASLSNLSFTVKYYVPLFVLIYGLWKFVFNDTKEFISYFCYFLMLVISILCQEASLTFPFILIVLNIIRKAPLRCLYVLILIPSLAYFVARVFFFKIPNAGWMEVSWPFLIKSLWLAMDSTFTYTLHISGDEEVRFLSLVVLVIYLGGIIYFAVKKDKMPLIYFGVWVLLVLPFCVLKNHFFTDRLIWSSVIPSICLSYVFAYILEKSKKKMPVIILLVMVSLFSISRYMASHQLHLSWYADRLNSFDAWRKKINPYFVNSLENEKTIEFQIHSKYLNKSLEYERERLLHYLASIYPRKLFLVTFIDDANSVRNLIKGGTVYYDENEKGPNIYSDIYSRLHQFRIKADVVHKIPENLLFPIE